MCTNRSTWWRNLCTDRSTGSNSVHVLERDAGTVLRQSKTVKQSFEGVAIVFGHSCPEFRFVVGFSNGAADVVILIGVKEA